MEGAFANGSPVDGDQITFARLRANVTSGLCPNTPYVLETPYGVINFTTDAAGALPRNAGTVDTGCSPVAPATCDFSEALAADSRISPNGDTFAQSFLRWDPAEIASPDNYLGDARAFHKVVGGTYVPPGESQPVNKFAIFDTAGNVVGQTDTFTVSGKLAGPLQADAASVDFGHQPAGQTSGNRTVTVTNVAPTATTVSAIALQGANSGDFRVTGGTCAGATVPTDGTCTVTVAFAPAAAGTKNATLSITPAGGGPGGAGEPDRHRRRRGGSGRPGDAGRAGLRHGHRRHTVDAVDDGDQHRHGATGGRRADHHRHRRGGLLGHREHLQHRGTGRLLLHLGPVRPDRAGLPDRESGHPAQRDRWQHHGVADRLGRRVLVHADARARSASGPSTATRPSP